MEAEYAAFGDEPVSERARWWREWRPTLLIGTVVASSLCFVYGMLTDRPRPCTHALTRMSPPRPRSERACARRRGAHIDGAGDICDVRGRWHLHDKGVGAMRWPQLSKGQCRVQGMVPLRVHVHRTIAMVLAVHADSTAARSSASTIADAIAAAPATTISPASSSSTSPVAPGTSSAAPAVRQPAVDAMRWRRLQRGHVLPLWVSVHKPGPRLFAVCVRMTVR